MRLDVMTFGCMLLQQIATEPKAYNGQYKRLVVAGNRALSQDQVYSDNESFDAKDIEKPKLTKKTDNYYIDGNRKQNTNDNMLRKEYRRNFNGKNIMGFDAMHGYRLKHGLLRGLEPRTKHKRGRFNTTQGGRMFGIVRGIHHLLGSVRRRTKSIMQRLMTGSKRVMNSVKANFQSKLGLARTVLHAAGGVAENMILKPLLGVEAVISAKAYVISLGKKLAKRLVHGITSRLGKGWEVLKAVQLPGWNVVMYFPKGLITIVNHAANMVVFISRTTARVISATKAFAIFVATNTAGSLLRPALRALSMDCIRMPAHNYKVNNAFVDGLQTSTGEICGIVNIKAVNNITITADDESVLIVVVPFKIKNLNIFFNAVNLTGITGTLVGDAPMNVTIKQLEVFGTKNFRAGTLFKFVSVHLRVHNVIGFNIRFHGEEEHSSALMGAIESISGSLNPIIVDTINEQWNKFEKQVSDAIQYMLDERHFPQFGRKYKW